MTREEASAYRRKIEAEAETLVEMQDELPSFIPIPTYQPVAGVEEPWRPPYRFTACNNQVKAE